MKTSGPKKVGGLSGGLKKWEVKYYPIYPIYIFRDYFDKP